ncbi:hypothetical protein SAMD00019534_015460, partial [Acytostelium subglobosum LB1]|uniref:hypothetical protein n=1 Tax=Acytostelium subglobosum LB1 TaxID=1410327 RepID=UPI000645158E
IVLPEARIESIIGSFPSLTRMSFHGHTFISEEASKEWFLRSTRTLHLEESIIVLKAGMIPPTLTHLTLGDNFSQSLSSKLLPSSLIELHLGSKFNHPLVSLPSGLTTLSIGDSFNQPLTSRLLPQSLTKLKLGNGFNQLLPSLRTLKRLALGQAFIDKNIMPMLTPDEFTKKLKSNDYTTKAQFTVPLELVWFSYITLLRHPVMLIRSVMSFFPSASVCLIEVDQYKVQYNKYNAFIACRRVDQQTLFCLLEKTKNTSYLYGIGTSVHREIKIINMMNGN